MPNVGDYICRTDPLAVMHDRVAAVLADSVLLASGEGEFIISDGVIRWTGQSAGRIPLSRLLRPSETMVKDTVRTEHGEDRTQYCNVYFVGDEIG